LNSRGQNDKPALAVFIVLWSYFMQYQKRSIVIVFTVLYHSSNICRHVM